MDGWWSALAAAAIVVAIVFGVRWYRRAASAAPQASEQRHEALFKAAFPELQPLFHPAKVLEFVAAWRTRGPQPPGARWLRPPGLDAARAQLSPGSKGEAVELYDETGALVSQFRLQPHPDGGVLRLDPGKFTVNVRDAAVRYWHPEREFKWSRAKGWRVITRLSDQAIDSTDRGFESARDTSSSSPSASTVATTAAVIAAAGGTFAGGGASAKWDDAADSPAGSESGAGGAVVDVSASAAADDASGNDSETPSAGTAY